MHPEWSNVRCLISAHSTVIQELLTIHPEWILFTYSIIDYNTVDIGDNDLLYK